MPHSTEDILFMDTINDMLDMDKSGGYLKKISQKFFDSTTDLVQEIEQSAKENNHADLLAQLHRLKGVAGISGAKHLHHICDRVRTQNKYDIADSQNQIAGLIQGAIDQYQLAIKQTLSDIQR